VCDEDRTGSRVRLGTLFRINAFSIRNSQGRLRAMKMKALVAAIMVVGLAAPTMAVSAKTKHHKMSHAKGMSSKQGAGSAGDTSSNGNVGPGTSNNNTK
jgi:hypothetical protein